MTKKGVKRSVDTLPQYEKHRKTIDLYKADIPKIKAQAQRQGYRNIKSYLEDLIHNEACK